MAKMAKRKRTRQTMSFKERLEAFASRAREQAAKLAEGPEREDLLLKAREAETALFMEGWSKPPSETPLTARRPVK
jgi:hypothetical protein